MRAVLAVVALAGVIAAAGCAKGADEGEGVTGDGSTSPPAPDAGGGDPIDAGPDVTWPGIDADVDSSPSGDDAGDATVADVVADAPPPDAGCDAATPARIPATGSDSFASPVDPRWAAVGSADIGITTQGWTVLTTDATNKAGALWWNQTYLFDHFDVTFSFQIDNKSSGADGLAFAWVPGGDVTKVGGGGNGYGFSGLGGFAVAVDTYQNSGDPSAPFLTVIDSNQNQITRQAIPNVRDGTTHGMRVVVQNAAVTVWIDGTQYVNAFGIPSYAPFVGHWGFTASTGSQSEKHMVTGIAMLFPDGQGCPSAGD